MINDGSKHPEKYRAISIGSAIIDHAEVIAQRLHVKQGCVSSRMDMPLQGPGL
jgi:hypothetical protein